MSVRRSRRHPVSVLAVVAMLWAAALLVVAPSASRPAREGILAVISVGDQGTGLVGAVAGRPFDVVVEARDPLGAPLVPTQDTSVRLSLVTGSGALAAGPRGHHRQGAPAAARSPAPPTRRSGTPSSSASPSSPGPP